MKIYRPLRPSLNYKDNSYRWNKDAVPCSTVGQRFGDNKVCVYPGGQIFSTWDAVCPVGSESAYKKLWGLDGHNGLDIACRRGDPIFASHDGVVSKIEGNKDVGYGVRVLSDPFEYGGKMVRLETIYWHILPIFIQELGTRVVAGNLIGLGDSTGNSTGDHLHFGMKLYDMSGNKLNPNNGYDGASDPLEFLEEKDAIDYYGERFGVVYKKVQMSLVWLFQYVAKIRFGGNPVDFDEKLLLK